MRANGRILRRQQWTEAARMERLTVIRAETRTELEQLAVPLADPEQLRGQIENLIGMVRVPVGVAGPLRVRGEVVSGSFYVPLATTEGTLVLAVTRGAEAISAAGGAEVRATQQRVTRAPLFLFASHEAAHRAGCWAVDHFAQIQVAAEATTRHGKLIAVAPVPYGRRLVLEFVYTTGDAAGQNLVTFATDAACRWLMQHPPFDEAEFVTLESNLSHDKKAAALHPSRCRGRQVDADITIPRAVVASVLKAEPGAMARVAREGVYASVLSGSIGAQAQFANVLAALFVATGQDVATVAECGTGLTVMEETSGGDLYAGITIPNLVIGSVGGGTRLASQRECLELMGCAGSGCASRLAEIAGAAVLAGELALVAALASGTFAQAHAAFGRPPRAEEPR